MAEFYMGLAEMERIDMEAWLEGQREQEWIRPAIESFGRAYEHFELASRACALFEEWVPHEHREQLRPAIDHFEEMKSGISKITDSLRNGELPSLRLVHSISTALRYEEAFGERQALALRGTRGYFPAGAE
jgi:hypothetical protein